MPGASMTGYGRARAETPAGSLAVELSGVNNKQFAFVFSAPPEFARHEICCRDAVASRIARGRVQCRVTFAPAPGRAPEITPEAVLEFSRKLQEISEQTGVKNDCGLAFIAGAIAARQAASAAPSAFAAASAPAAAFASDSAAAPFDDQSALEKNLAAALAAALDDFAAMRAKEGAMLAADLGRRIDALRAEKDEVAALAADVPARVKAALIRRVAELGVELPADDAAIAREAALIADKSDIAEELTRLDAHFAHFASILASDAPAGRKLDFLCQEIGRETNTIGSKAGDGRISRHVIEMKALLETIREQVQNLE